jgi:putative endonuclease
MWYVYILELSNKAYYTGITNNLDRRLKTHSDGKGSKYVRAHLPLTLVYKESCDSKSIALRREAAIKRLNHNKKKELIGGV